MSRFLALLLASLTAAVLVARVEPALAAGQANKGPAFHTLVDELHKTNVILARANPVYQGNRENAMEHIHKAVVIFEQEGNIKNKVKKPAENKKVTLNQTQSDALLRQSVQRLAVVQQQMVGLPNTPPNARAAEHIRLAIAALETALTVK